MLYLFSVYLVFKQQMLNELFEHYDTLTTLLGKTLTPTVEKNSTA